MSDIIIGTPAQIQTVQRATALWTLLQNDPRFAFQGRTVSLAGEHSGAAGLVIALSRLQGYASCHFVSKATAQDYCTAYQAAGLNTQIWDQYWGRETALSKSQAFLQGFDAPQGLTLKTVSPHTSDTTIRKICEMSLQAGVLPAPGSVMRGLGRKGVFLYLEAADGQIVASGGACMAYHPDGPRADEAFWGMLATHETWRGKRLGCWLGAQIIQDMAKTHGAGGFSSGVKPDNPSSQAMCRRLGVEPSVYRYAGAIDPAAFGGASITR